MEGHRQLKPLMSSSSSSSSPVTWPYKLGGEREVLEATIRAVKGSHSQKVASIEIHSSVGR